jgi:hypothetical protein
MAKTDAILPCRRSVLRAAAILGLSAGLAVAADVTLVSAAEDPQPSWNDGLIKQSLIEFVQAVTDSGNA